MSLTSQIFLAAGLPIRADAIKRNGPGWLARRRLAVEKWAADFGLDLGDAINTDLGIWDPIPPDETISVDVIIPFCHADTQFLREAVESILVQNYVSQTIHIVSDGAVWPELPHHTSIKRYETPGGWGPYRITNGVFHNIRSRWIALQDADDVSLPDRLWKQIQIARHFKATMISSGMDQFLEDDAKGDALLSRRFQLQPRLLPGDSYHTVKRGRCINSTRTMRRSMFELLNGFAPMFCSGDFEFDTRAKSIGIPVHDDRTIQAHRRLHKQSLTGGPHRAGSPRRLEGVQLILDNAAKMEASPTLDMAQSLGSLDKTETLHPVN